MTRPNVIAGMALEGAEAVEGGEEWRGKVVGAVAHHVEAEAVAGGDPVAALARS